MLLGNGDGTFTPSYQLELATGGNAALGDLNRDGKLDLVTTDYNSGVYSVYVLPGKGDGTFGAPVTYTPPYPGYLLFAATGDVNGDGKLDIVADGVSVFLGKGDGTFTGDGGVSVPYSGSSMILGDFNNDNKLDAIALEFIPFSNTLLAVMLGNGDGTFQNPARSDSGFDTGNYAYQFSLAAVGDFNGDGKLDVVDINTDENTGSEVLSVFLQSALSVSSFEVNFGTVKVGSSSPPQTVTLTNIGNSTLSIGPPNIIGGSSAFKGDSNCSTLTPGFSCTITGTFSPKFKGTFSAQVQVSYKGAVGSPQIIEIVGTGD